MSVLDGYDITQFMDLNEEERQFLEFYRRIPQELRDIIDKFMDGTPQERKEAGEIIYSMIDELKAQNEEAERMEHEK